MASWVRISPYSMSTSNIKSPSVIRQGYANSWENHGLVPEFGIQFLKWELNKQNVTPVRYLSEGGVLIVFYYKWTQLPFKSKVSKRLSEFIKQKIKNTPFWEQNDLVSARINSKPIKGNKRLSLIDSAIKSQKDYQIPLIMQTLLLQSLVSVNSVALKDVRFINIFEQAEFANRLLDVKRFASETPLVKSNLKSIYHVLDMILIVDLFSLKICNGELVGTLIGKILGRSSKKGLFIRSLRVLLKLPALIRKFEIKERVSNSRNWRWNIRITGKISGMGRTKVYSIFSEKMPLHTISNSINYCETIINTKAGSFSIKIWSLQ